MQVPTTHDEIVRHSRDIVAAMRQQFPDRQDYDRWVKRALAETLTELGYDQRAIYYTLTVIFGSP